LRHIHIFEINMLQKTDCPYQAYYCEENIWKLCQLEFFEDTAVQILFLLPSQANFIAVWQQQLAKAKQPVFWDYHVILLDKSNAQIYDFDSLLPFPVDAKEYFSSSFAMDFPAYLPQFKVFERKDFIERFSSDRSHMLDEQGNWMASPPVWPCILNNNGIDLKKILLKQDASFCKSYSYREMLNQLG